jgi:hypothetical protein
MLSCFYTFVLLYFRASMLPYYHASLLTCSHMSLLINVPLFDQGGAGTPDLTYGCVSEVNALALRYCVTEALAIGTQMMAPALR